MANIKHFETLYGATKEYRAWRAIKSRCSNPKTPLYKYYGAIGIRVCLRWTKSYDSFLNDMGRAPSPKHSIDRRNNKGNYTPKNCRWATDIEQQNNRNCTIKIKHLGKTKSLSEWCRELKKVSYQAAYMRIKYAGLDPVTAITKPSNRL
jgi:hypothetical protein